MILSRKKNKEEESSKWEQECNGKQKCEIVLIKERKNHRVSKTSVKVRLATCLIGQPVIIQEKFIIYF